MMTGWFLIAQEQAAPAAAQDPFSQSFMLVVPMLVIFGLYFVIVAGPERKKTRDKQKMIDQLKKNDKVLTIGGIYGVVANAKPGDDEVVLKIDEDKDVRMRVSKSAIASVIVSKESSET